MALVDELGDELAIEALALAKKLGSENIVDEVSKLIGASSTTLQESYLTSIRYRRALARGIDLIRETERTGTVETTPDYPDS